MARKRFAPEQIITMLREAEVLLNQATLVAEVCRKRGISEQAYYRWRKEYGGMRVDRVRRLKELEQENARLKKLVADLALDKAILKEVNRGKLLSPAKRGRAVDHACEVMGVSERRAYQVLARPRSTQRHVRKVPED